MESRILNAPNASTFTVYSERKKLEHELRQIINFMRYFFIIFCTIENQTSLHK